MELPSMPQKWGGGLGVNCSAWQSQTGPVWALPPIDPSTAPASPPDRPMDGARNPEVPADGRVMRHGGVERLRHLG